MSIVTVSHAAFTGGSEIAQKTALNLNYRSVNREVLIEASQRYGIPEAKFTEVWETEGHWWERWLESQRLDRITLQAAMCELAEGGRIGYHGRAGQELFRGVRHAMEVLISAARTRNVILNVRSDGGRVYISGILADPDLEKEIVRIAKGVSGVTDIVTDIEPPPIEYMHP